MSSPERRRQNEERLDRERAEQDKEYARKEALSMYMRIYEADASEDVKDILHRICMHVGIEQ